MITELIFDWAERTPEKTAIVYNGKPSSYRSFAQFIAQARGYFLRRGVVGDGVAVLAVHNLTDFWGLSLALRSLGLTTFAAQSANVVGALGLPGVRCVVTSPAEAWPGLDRWCAERGLTLLSVSLSGEPGLGLGASEAPDPPGGHILQTSGTTGVFKMVLMSPAIDAVFLRRKAEVIGMDQDTVLSVFDFGPWTAAGYRWAASPWVVGGTTLIEQWREPYRALLRPGLTHAVLIPAVLAAVLAAPVDAFPRNEALQLAVGGGAMTRTQVEQAKARITPHLFNWLASTEAGGIAYTPLDTPEDHRWHRLIPGREVQIVDDSDRTLATGELGRVRVSAQRGPNGYLHDEAATPDFFRGGFFYPGDLAVIRSDGRMALQGRVTDIINVRGHKISPALIEDRLGEAFGVSGVCLFSVQDDGGEEEVHVVVETPSPIESERLITVLNRELAGFPRARVHYLASLPRNQMGKVLRQAVRTRIVGG